MPSTRCSYEPSCLICNLVLNYILEFTSSECPKLSSQNVNDIWGWPPVLSAHGPVKKLDHSQHLRKVHNYKTERLGSLITSIQSPQSGGEGWHWGPWDTDITPLLAWDPMDVQAPPHPTFHQGLMKKSERSQGQHMTSLFGFEKQWPVNIKQQKLVALVT